MSIFIRLLILFAVVLVLVGIVEIFAYDVIKIQWVGFMGLQPSYQPMHAPLPVSARSIPIEGPAFIPNMGAPANPVPADQLPVSSLDCYWRLALQHIPPWLRAVSR